MSTYRYCVDINTIVVYRICEIQNTVQFTIRGSVRQYILVQDFVASDERDFVATYSTASLVL